MVYNINGEIITETAFPYHLSFINYGLVESTQYYEKSDTVRISKFFQKDGDSLTVEHNGTFQIRVLFYDENYAFLGNQNFSSTYVIDYSLYPTSKYIMFKIYIDGQTDISDQDVKDNPIYITSGVYIKTNQNTDVIVASAECTDEQKKTADFICNGVDDVQAIQHAICQAYAWGCKTLLLDGTYILNSIALYDDGATEKTCLYIESEMTQAQFKTDVRFWEIEGINKPLAYKNGVIFMLGDTLYNSLTSTQQISIIRGTKITNPVPNNGGVSALSIKNIIIRLPANQKKITCIDLNYTHACNVEWVKCMAVDPDEGYGYFSPTNVKPVPVPVEGCNGILGTFGSNWNVDTVYKNIECYGFYVGFDVSGEHVLVENASMKYCWYGFTFEHCKKIVGDNSHPIVCNNLLDEHSMHMPIFDKTSKQPIYITGMNFMFPHIVTFEGYSGDDYDYNDHDFAVDVSGETRGFVYYNDNTLTTGLLGGNQVFPKFFKTGGTNFKCINAAHSMAAPSSVIMTYDANYMQECYDTTLNKLVIYNGSNWVDTFGTVVY